jgi:multiple sugar transport system substrate-binding protein
MRQFFDEASIPAQPLSRRRVLRLLGLGATGAGGAVLLAACGAGTTGTATTSSAVAATSAVATSTTAAASSAATTTTAPATTSSSSVVTSASSTASSASAITSASTTTSTAAAVAASSVSPGGKLELNLWTTWGDKDQVAEQAMADSFAKTQSNVTVKVTTKSDGDPFTTAMASGNPPDMIQTWNAAEVATWATSGGVVQMNSFIGASKMDLTKLDPAGLAAGQLFGKQYGMPMLVYTNTLLFWNKSIFQDVGLDPNTPPATWQDLLTYAQKITQKQGDTFTRMGFVPNFAQGGIGNIVWSFGGQLYSDDGKQVTPDNPGVVKSVEYTRQQIVQFGGQPAISAFSKGFGTNEKDPFYISQIAMVVNGEWLPTFITKYKPDLDYGIGYLPYDESAPQAKNSGNIATNLIVMPKDAKHQQQAWEFIAYANTPEPNVKLATALGNTPQVLAAAATMQQAAATPQLKFIFQAHQSKNMHATPINPISSEYNKDFNAAVGNVLAGKADAPSALAQVKTIIQPKLDAITKGP